MFLAFQQMPQFLEKLFRLLWADALSPSPLMDQRRNYWRQQGMSIFFGFRIHTGTHPLNFQGFPGTISTLSACQSRFPFLVSFHAFERIVCLDVKLVQHRNLFGGKVIPRLYCHLGKSLSLTSQRCDSAAVSQVFVVLSQRGIS